MNRSFPRHAVIALLGGLFQTRLYHLGRLFQTRLYHLHPCRRAFMQAYRDVGVDSGLRRNDDWGGNGIVTIPTAPLLCLPNS